MLEQVTDAIVLDKEPTYEAHARIHLFTKDWGRISARATSARKITAKLGPHLEPLMITTVQIAERGHVPQLTDAIEKGRLPYERFDALRIVRALAPEYEPDPELWALLVSPRPASNAQILSVLGYDPRFAQCERCGGDAVSFSLASLAFACAPCRDEYGILQDCVAA